MPPRDTFAPPAPADELASGERLEGAGRGARLRVAVRELWRRADLGRRAAALRASRGGRALAWLALVAAVVAVLGWLRLPSYQPPGGATDPDAEASRPPATVTGAPSRNGPPAERTDLRVVLRGAGWSVVDVDAGQRYRIPLPAGSRPATASAPLLLRAAAVVPVLPRGAASDAVPTWLYASMNGVRGLGPGERVVRSPDGESVWVVQPAGADGRRRALLVTPDRAPHDPVVLPAGYTAFAEVQQGLVVGLPVQAGPMSVVARDSQVVRVLTTRGRVQDADALRLFWSPCQQADCGLLLTDLRDGTTRQIEPLPDGYIRAGGAVLSNDGRHYAAPAWGPDRARLVIIGHLPGESRENAVTAVRTAPGDLARIGYSANGWLLAASGSRLTYAGPGPHTSYEVPQSALPPPTDGSTGLETVTAIG